VLRRRPELCTSARQTIPYPNNTFIINYLRESCAISGMRRNFQDGTLRRSSSKKFRRRTVQECITLLLGICSHSGVARHALTCCSSSTYSRSLLFLRATCDARPSASGRLPAKGDPTEPTSRERVSAKRLEHSGIIRSRPINVDEILDSHGPCFVRSRSPA